MKFYIRVFFENMSSKRKFHENRTRITDTLHDDQYIFLVTSRSFLLRMRNVSNKCCRENQNTHFMFNFLNRAVYEITWKNTAEPGRPQMTIRRMRIACWIPKATNVLSEYVPLIEFPLQRWLHERASMLRYTYTVRLVLHTNCSH